MKRVMRFFLAVLLLGAFAVILFVRYYPIMNGLKKQDLLSETRNYIVCKAAYTTGFEWLVVENSSYNGYVFVEGVMENPYLLKYYILPCNTFVLYGEFIGEREFDGNVYPVFKANDWDVLFPVKRRTLPHIISPSYGLTWLDFEKQDK